MKKDKPLSALVAEMVAGMDAFRDAIEAAEALSHRFTIRTVTLELEAKPYGPEDALTSARRAALGPPPTTRALETGRTAPGEAESTSR